MDKIVAQAVVGAAAEIAAAAVKLAEDSFPGLGRNAGRAGKEALEGGSVPGAGIKAAGDALHSGEGAVSTTEALLRQPAWSKGAAIRGVSAYIEGVSDRLGIRDTSVLSGQLAPRIGPHEINAVHAVLQSADSLEAGEKLIRSNPRLVDAVSDGVANGDFRNYQHAVRSLKENTEFHSSPEGRMKIREAQAASGDSKEAMQLARSFRQDMDDAGFTLAHQTNPRIAHDAFKLYVEDPKHMGNGAIAARVTGTVDKPAVVTVGKMLDAGWEAKDITRPDLQTAQAIGRHDAGYPTPAYVRAVRMHPQFTPGISGELPKPVLDDVVIPKLQAYLRKPVEQ